MKAASIVSNTDTLSKPVKDELFATEDNNSACAFVNNNVAELPMSIFNSMPSFPNTDEPISLESSTCWNMPGDLDMSSLLDPSLWAFDSSTAHPSPTTATTTNTNPLDGLCKNDHPFQTPHADQPAPPWPENNFAMPPTPSYSLPPTRPQSSLSGASHENNATIANQHFPPTPPVDSQSTFLNNNHAGDGVIQAPIPLPFQHQPPPPVLNHAKSQSTSSASSMMMMMTSPFDSQQQQQQSTTAVAAGSHTGSPVTTHFNPSNNDPSRPSSNSAMHHHNHLYHRRRSDQQPYRKNSSTTPGIRRRASSVASVVSLTAHEPIAHLVNGVEHITFLYSHDRLIKEYTVRTDVNQLPMEEVPMDFRLQNAIYPRANVDKEDYDGNRWNYETSCNELGWKLCWLNRDQLFGKRGLIQRAVDSYRNRHAELRSRRVTRQEKLANGTLRKRRAKKMAHSLF
ncbi:hypothetical protein BCR42DRAFT_466140 [Absidia repens]|uniref:DUF8032 domain-containing protein n=1 Tax=Absidia repens TaxID=90262 RepID=A0A1X2IER5_9FUNG|nr:hypothetical protein BCR42DRAFT_466140 [Absidia repens]